MIRGEDGQVFGVERLFESRHPGIELLESGAVALHIVTMPILLIEIHQIDEDQAAVERVHGAQSFGHTVGVGFRFFVFADSTAQKHVENLADAEDVDVLIGQAVEQHPARRRHRIIVAIGRALKGTGLADKRTRDDASNFVRAPQDLARRFAHLVQLK